jgi:hypothetical protein
MGFRGALVDTAYRIRQSPTRKRVEGSTVFQPNESEPIKARLTINTAGERTEDGRVLTEPQPTLVVYRKDLLGETLDWKASDRIRVESVELGTHDFEIQGEPQPMRKKRRVIGWTFTLRRTEENEVWGRRGS